MSAVAAALLAVPVTAAGASTTSPGSIVFGGNAYGSAARLGSVVNSGHTAAVPLCTLHAGIRHADKTGQLSLPGVGAIGSVTTATRSIDSGSTVESRSRTSTAHTRLFAGQVKFDGVSTVARAIHSAAGYRTVGTTTFTNLTIAGKSMPQHPARNQTMTLPGVGKVILNEQHRHTTNGTHRISIVALHLVSTNAQTPGSVIIGRSSASLHNPVHRLPYGSAYGTRVQVAGAAGSGRTAPITLPCGGTGSKTVTNSTVAGSFPQAVSASSVASSGRSDDAASATDAVTRSRVSGLNLGAGQITAKTVTAVATANKAASGLTRSSKGTDVAGLVIQGKSYNGSAPANTQIAVPGVGTLWLHRVTRTPTGVQVVGLQLVVTANSGSFQKGSTITVAAANAGVRR